MLGPQEVTARSAHCLSPLAVAVAKEAHRPPRLAAVAAADSMALAEQDLPAQVVQQVNRAVMAVPALMGLRPVDPTAAVVAVVESAGLPDLTPQQYFSAQAAVAQAVV